MMAYRFDFAAVFQHSDLLLAGAGFTLALTAVAPPPASPSAILGAVSRAWRLPLLNGLFGVYVEVIRNTPFLVQLFFIFFGLPALGVKMTEWQAAVLAMVINLGAIRRRSSAPASRPPRAGSWKRPNRSP